MVIAWSVKKTEVKRIAQNRGPRITAIPILCTERMIDLDLYQGNVNGATIDDGCGWKAMPQLASI